MKGRRVLADDRGNFISGIERTGNILQLSKTTDPEAALEATPEAVQLLADWQERCKRYGCFDQYQVIDVEQHAGAC